MARCIKYKQPTRVEAEALMTDERTPLMIEGSDDSHSG